MMDWRLRLFCINAAWYCHNNVWKGELWKLLFQLCSNKTKKHIWSRRLLSIAREKRAKISITIFPKTALGCRFEPLMYFIFLDNTLSIAVFNLIKLVFETQAAKLWQRGVMGRGKNVSGSFLTQDTVFSSYCIFWERPKKPGGMTSI